MAPTDATKFNNRTADGQINCKRSDSLETYRFIEVSAPDNTGYIMDRHKRNISLRLDTDKETDSPGNEDANVGWNRIQRSNT